MASGTPFDGKAGASPTTLLEAVLNWANGNRSKLALLAAAGLSAAAVAFLIQQRRGHGAQADGSPVDDTVRLDFAQFLPEELSLNIFYRCRAEDFVRASQVCKEWKRLCDDDIIWREIYQRKWRKVAALMSLKYQTRWRSSWKDLYVERDRIEKAYFHNNPPSEMKADSECGLFLYREAREHLYYTAVEDRSSEGLAKMAFAIVVMAIAGEKFEAQYLADPTDYQTLWNWGAALSTQAQWIGQLLRYWEAGEPMAGVTEHRKWLYEFASEKYEQALALVPPDMDGLQKHLQYAEHCAERAHAAQDFEEGRRYLEKAHAYFRRAITRAQAVQFKAWHQSPDSENPVYEVDTVHDLTAVARAHRGIGTSCMSRAEKLYAAVSEANRKHKETAAPENMDEEAEEEEEEEEKTENEKRMTKEREELLEVLREGRENMMVCVKFQPDQMDHLICLGDLLTMLGEMAEDADEAETYFNEGATNFERALTIDEGGDAVNEYGILLTKRAQRVLKQLRLEGLADLAADDDHDYATHTDDHAAVNEGVQAPIAAAEDSEAATLMVADAAGERSEVAPAQNESGQEGAMPAQGGQTEVQKEEKEEEDEELARRRARRRELLARANRYFDAAETKFLELNTIGVWYGAINLACLAALRGREEETEHWLKSCRERNQMEPETLDDADFDVYRERQWFVDLRAELTREREERQREEELAREREAEETRRMEEEAAAAAAAAAAATASYGSIDLPALADDDDNV